MNLVRWAELPAEQIGEHVVRQATSGEKATLARFRFAKGTHVSAHAHESEQYTCVLQGAIRAQLAGEPADVCVREGEVLLIPPNVQHEVWVLEESLLLDFFVPPRLDWLAGRHQYLEGR
jgi:quercetin dioxygenase-like cupin family protein